VLVLKTIPREDSKQMPIAKVTEARNGGEDDRLLDVITERL